MGSLATGLALALGASISQSAGFLFQHIQAAERPKVSPLRPVATLGSMLRSKWWVVGLACAIAGYVLHTGAIAIAPLSLVQAFFAGGLALAVPLAAIGFRHRLQPVERRAVIVMAAALAVLPIGVVHTEHHFQFDPARLAIYLGAVGLFAVVPAAASGARRYQALALAAGLLYGILDSATKAITDLFHRHGLAVALRSPWMAVALVSAVAAFFCFQRTLQMGRALTAIGIMEAAADSSSILAGFIAFGDSLGSSVPLAGLHGLAFLAVGFAAVSLARAQGRLVGEGEQALEADGGVHGRSTKGEPGGGVAQGERQLPSP